MNVNALRQYMQFANENEYGGKGWGDPTSGSSFNPSGLRMEWAERMASKTPNQPDAYDLQQQANSQASSMSTMRNASRMADVQDMDAMQRFMPKQAPQEQYDAEGFPVGRNYGGNLHRQQMRTSYIPDLGDGGGGYQATLRARGAMPNFFADAMPRREHGAAPQMQSPQSPDISNYLARLLGSR